MIRSFIIQHPVILTGLRRARSPVNITVCHAGLRFRPPRGAPWKREDISSKQRDIFPANRNQTFTYFYILGHHGYVYMYL